jgi:hypothetical protein
LNRSARNRGIAVQGRRELSSFAGGLVVVQHPRIRSAVLFVSVLFAPVAAVAAEAAAAPILGVWRGTSLCVDRAVAPACKDEVIVYTVTPVAGHAGARVHLRGDKIVDGEIVPMGEFDLDHDEATGSWRAEVRTPKFRILWSYSVEGSRLIGTLTDLATDARIRRVEATRDDQGVAPMRFLAGGRKR